MLQKTSNSHVQNSNTGVVSSMMNTSDNKLWYLKNYNLFQGISDEDLYKISEDIDGLQCQKGCKIYDSEKTADYIYIVKNGEVQLFHQKGEKKFIFDTLGPGSIFGGVSFTENEYGHSAEAIAGSYMCVFPREAFKKILSAYPETMLKYMEYVTQRLQEYQAQFDKLNDSAEELILHELTRLHQKRQQSFFGQFLVNRPLRATHEEIARLTGLNRVTVTRAMKSLKAKNKVCYDTKTGAISFSCGD